MNRTNSLHKGRWGSVIPNILWTSFKDGLITENQFVSGSHPSRVGAPEPRCRPRLPPKCPPSTAPSVAPVPKRHTHIPDTLQFYYSKVFRSDSLEGSANPHSPWANPAHGGTPPCTPGTGSRSCVTDSREKMSKKLSQIQS